MFVLLSFFRGTAGDFFLILSTFPFAALILRLAIFVTSDFFRMLLSGSFFFKVSVIALLLLVPCVLVEDVRTMGPFLLLLPGLRETLELLLTTPGMWPGLSTCSAGLSRSLA